MKKKKKKVQEPREMSNDDARIEEKCSVKEENGNKGQSGVAVVGFTNDAGRPAPSREQVTSEGSKESCRYWD